VSKFTQLSGEEILQVECDDVPQRVSVLPDWLKIKDDPEHMGDPDWFLVEADFDIAQMPDAVDAEIEQKCGIEKLFVLFIMELVNPSDPASTAKARKLMKVVKLHNGSFLTREECMRRAVPILSRQRDLKLGLIPPPKPPPEPDTSNLGCLFF